MGRAGQCKLRPSQKTQPVLYACQGGTRRVPAPCDLLILYAVPGQVRVLGAGQIQPTIMLKGGIPSRNGKKRINSSETAIAVEI